MHSNDSTASSDPSISPSVFRLKWPSIPSPLWFGSGRREHQGTVQVDGTVRAEGSDLELLDGPLPPAGTAVVLIKERLYLTAEPAAEYHVRQERERAARELDVRERQAAHEHECHERQVRRQTSAAQANSQLRIPVRWTSGLKTVLSGLSRNSSGCGENARSVTHVLLLESIEDGRFQRRAQSFLCTSAGGTDGRAWTERLHTSSVGVDGPYVSRVTCRQCLKVATRWKDADGAAVPELVRD